MRRKRIIEMSSFGDDPIKDLGFVVFPASAGLDQRDCLFCAFSVGVQCVEHAVQAFDQQRIRHCYVHAHASGTGLAA